MNTVTKTEQNKSDNVVWHHATVTREHREKLNQHKGVILWFTGFSGSGKSTLAHAVEEALYKRKCRTYVLDGDNVRHGLCGDLGFSDDDRKENIRRIGNVAKLFLDSGTIVVTAFISPFRLDRKTVRNMVAHDDFFEIYCNASIEVCEQRDTKGMYKKAREGLIHDFTGITSPYEVPVNPELTVNTGEEPLEQCVDNVVRLLVERGIIK